MPYNYGPPALDFTPLAKLGETFFRSQERAEDRAQKQELRQSLASLGQGNLDYEALGRRMLSMGDVSNGIGFLKLAQDEKTKAAQLQASQGFAGSINSIFGGGSAPTYGATSGTPRASIDRNTVYVAETEDDVQRLERATGMNVAPDLDKVVRTVYGEAAGEGPTGQAAVAGVIANRARQSGMTPTDVVLAKGQFEPWSDPIARARMENLDPNSPDYQRIAATVRPVLEGTAPDPTGGADHFYSPGAQAKLGRNAPAWDDGTGQDIGNHRFFQKGYRPQGPVQVAQADIPNAEASNAQGFLIPGQAPAPANTPQSRLAQSIPMLIQAASNPNLPEGQRTMANTLLTQALAESKLTDEQKEYAMARAQGYNGTFMEFKTALKKAGATNVNVDAGQKGQNKFEETLGAKQAERWNGYITAADEAQTRKADIDQMRELSRKIGSQGSTANGKLLFGPFFEAAGIDVPGLPDLQAYDSLVKRLAPQMRAPGSGSTSDVEYKGFIAAIGPLSNHPAAREAILDTFEAAARNDLARGEIATRLATGEISRGQAEKELRALPSPLQAFREFRKANPDLVGQAIKEGRISGSKPNPAPSGAPRPGDVQDGYRFKGGNPADQNSWEKVQ